MDSYSEQYSLPGPGKGRLRLKKTGVGGCYLRAGQMLRVLPVHVVRTVVIHVNQLVGQHRPHLLLSQGAVGADDHLVVSEVIATKKQGRSDISRARLASPSSQSSLTGLTDDMSHEVKLTALTLQSLDQSPDQRRAESPGDQDLAL